MAAEEQKDSTDFLNVIEEESGEEYNVAYYPAYDTMFMKMERIAVELRTLPTLLTYIEQKEDGKYYTRDLRRYLVKIFSDPEYISPKKFENHYSSYIKNIWKINAKDFCNLVVKLLKVANYGEREEAVKKLSRKYFSPNWGIPIQNFHNTITEFVSIGYEDSNTYKLTILVTHGQNFKFLEIFKVAENEYWKYDAHTEYFKDFLNKFVSTYGKVVETSIIFSNLVMLKTDGIIPTPFFASQSTTKYMVDIGHDFQLADIFDDAEVSRDTPLIVYDKYYKVHTTSDTRDLTLEPKEGKYLVSGDREDNIVLVVLTGSTGREMKKNYVSVTLEKNNNILEITASSSIKIGETNSIDICKIIFKSLNIKGDCNCLSPKTKCEVINVKGEFIIPNVSFNTNILNDLILNDPMVSYFLTSNELVKASKNVTYVYVYFNGSDSDTGSLRASITSKVYDRTTKLPYNLGDDLPRGSPYVRVKITKATDSNSVDMFKIIMQKIFSYYVKNHDRIVEEYVSMLGEQYRNCFKKHEIPKNGRGELVAPIMGIYNLRDYAGKKLYTMKHTREGCSQKTLPSIVADNEEDAQMWINAIQKLQHEKGIDNDDDAYVMKFRINDESSRGKENYYYYACLDQTTSEVEEKEEDDSQCIDSIGKKIKTKKARKYKMVTSESKDLPLMQYTKNGIDHKVYFSPSDPYIGLKLNTCQYRKDYKVIPCCYKKDHTKIPTSSYYKYLNGLEIVEKSIGTGAIISSNKVVGKGGFGIIRDVTNIRDLLGIIDPDRDYYRLGVQDTVQSFLDCIDHVFYPDNSSRKGRDERNRKLINYRRREMHKHINASRQETYDLSHDEIIRMIEDEHEYFDPRRFIHMLESIYNCNIFVLYRDFENENGDFMMPHNAQSHYKYIDLKKPTILIYEHLERTHCDTIDKMGNFHSGKMCEILVSVPSGENPKKGYQLTIENNTVVRKLLKAYANRFRTSIGKTLLSYENPLSHMVGDIVSQGIDTFGKTRKIDFEIDGGIISIMTPPIVPLDIRVDENITRRTLATIEIFAKKYDLRLALPITNLNTVVLYREGPLPIKLEAYVDKDDKKDEEEAVVLSEKETMKNNKTIAKYLNEYLRYVFSPMMNDPNDFGVNIWELSYDKIMGILSNTIKNKGIVTITGNDYGDASALKPYFNSVDNAMIYNKESNSVLVKDQEILTGLLYNLTIMIKRNPKEMMKYKDKTRMSNSYVDATDFTSRKNQKIVVGKSNASRWLNIKGIRFDIVHNTIEETEEAYFFKHPKILRGVMGIMQPSDSFDNAQFIIKTWIKEGRNPGRSSQSAELDDGYNVKQYDKNLTQISENSPDHKNTVIIIVVKPGEKYLSFLPLGH